MDQCWSDIGKGDTHGLSKQGFQQLFEASWLDILNESPLETLVEGVVSGKLIGGSIAISQHTWGLHMK